MKSFFKNLFEFALAAIILSIVLPFMANVWDSHLRVITDEKLNQLLQAVANGENSRKIERLFSEVYSSKNYRKISVAVPEFASNNAVVKAAKEYLFTPYVFGGMNKSGVDCSGLICLAYRASGIKLPRSAELQFGVGTYISSMDQLKVGDLVFFAMNWKNKPTHVGLYVGDNKMIHASSKHKRVMCVRINTQYYKQRFIGGRRVIP